jgi:hypothetical protein
VPNYEGTARGNLIASHPRHRNAERHGLYGSVEVTDDVRALAVELAELAPWIPRPSSA